MVCPEGSYFNAAKTGCAADSTVSLCCQTCPLFATSNAARDGCVCNAGYIGVTAAATGALLSCEPCPLGVDCASTGLLWPDVELEEQFWQQREWVTDKAMSDANVAPLKCATKGICLGGANFSACAEGHTGIKCSSCELAPVQYFKAAGSRCKRCDDLAGPVVEMVTTVAVLVVLGVFVGLVKARMRRKARDEAKLRRMMAAVEAEEMQELLETHGKGNIVSALGNMLEEREAGGADGDAGAAAEGKAEDDEDDGYSVGDKVKIMLTSSQVLTALLGSITVAWPTNFLANVKFVSIAVDIDVFSMPARSGHLARTAAASGGWNAGAGRLDGHPDREGSAPRACAL